MEDLKAYIESGILELYVLGDVTPREKTEVEAMAAKHPTIKAELEEIEKSLELYAETNEVEPADHLRDRILNNLVVNLADDNTFEAKDKPATKVIQFERAKQNNFFKYAFAACFVLLIISVAALFSIYGRLKDSQNLVATLQGQNQQMANTVNLKDGEIGVLRDPTFKLLKMNGTPKSPQSALIIAWSPVKKKVWIDMATAKMPANDKDHQYQLWAIVAGKPVDLGVFDADTTSKDMKPMKDVELASAFAVTLEKRGGADKPTMDEMMVIGKF